MPIQKLGSLAPILTLMLCIGCGQSGSVQGDGAAPDTNPVGDAKDTIAADDVDADVANAADTAMKYAEQKKNEYLGVINAQVKELNKSIDEMMKKGEGLADDAKKEWQNSVEELKKERDMFKEELAKADKASEDAWDDVKGGLEEAWSALQESVDKAAGRFD